MKKPTNKNSMYQNYQRNLIKATVSTNVGINNYDRLRKTYGEDINRVEVLNVLKKQSKFTICWFTIFLTLGIICLAFDLEGWFNVLDLFVVMFNIYFISKGKAVGIVIGIIECFLYAYICLQSHLFGEVVKVLAISVPLNIYSLTSWILKTRKQRKGKYNEGKVSQDEFQVKKLTKKLISIYLIIGVAVAVACYFFLKYALGQTTALILGAISLTITIIGKILTAKQYMDSYIVFIMGDIICLAMWIQTLVSTPFEVASITMLIYYIACLSNDIFGFISWKGMYRKVVVNGGFLLALRDVKINKIAKVKRRYKGLHWDKQVDITKNS